jgi:hypothetical protein
LSLSQASIKKAEKLIVIEKSVNFSKNIFEYGIQGKNYKIILDLTTNDIEKSLMCDCQGFKCSKFNSNISKNSNLNQKEFSDCKHCYAVRILRGMILN